MIRPFFFENELDQLRRLLFQGLLKGVVRKVFCGSRLTQAASRRPVAAVKTLVDGHRPKAVIPQLFTAAAISPQSSSMWQPTAVLTGFKPEMGLM